MLALCLGFGCYFLLRIQCMRNASNGSFMGIFLTEDSAMNFGQFVPAWDSESL